MNSMQLKDKLKNVSKEKKVDFNTLLGYKDEGFTSLVASGDTNSDSLNSLSPTEEQLILAYRSMNSEEKEFFGKHIKKIVKS